MMQEIQIVDGAKQLDGLTDMMESVGEARLVTAWTDIATALLIIEVAKRAVDKAEWFPRGKWATIQSVQRRVDIELTKLWK